LILAETSRIKTIEYREDPISKKKEVKIVRVMKVAEDLKQIENSSAYQMYVTINASGNL
jgi:hypothetical protein